MAEDKSALHESKASKLPQLLSSWHGVVVAVFGILGALWAVLEFFNPIKNLDMTVVIEESAQFSLPDQASSLQKLALMYDGRIIPRVTLIRLAIVNTGNLPIEPPKDSPARDWILTLRSTSGAPLERVSEPVATPDFLKVTVEPGPTPDAIQLRLGVLNRKESIAMQVALIGGDANTPVWLKAETPEPRIPGLNVAVAKDGVRSRIANGFIAPVWAMALITLVGWLIVDIRRGRTSIDPPSWKLAGGLVAGLFSLLFASIFIAAGVSWLLSWVVYLVAFR
jgi:hypothetical protein